MQKFIRFALMAATVCGISFAVTACSSDNDSDSDNNKKQEEKQEDTLTPKLVGLWVTDYAESGSEGSKTWTRVVEDYRLYTDWQGGNSGNDNPDNNNLNKVNSNVDVNNGGGGVNVVR